MTATQVLPLNSTASTAIQLQQPCGYRIHNNQITINVTAVKNNRNYDNISGTLALELWALRQPYRGELFDGVVLAGTAIGEIFGQHFVGPCVYDLQFHEPPTGQWHLCLMLREWTATGYVTLDSINFDVPYLASWKPSIVDGGANHKVVHVDFSHAEIEPAALAAQNDSAEAINAANEMVIAPKAKTEVAPKPVTKKSKTNAAITKKPTKTGIVAINSAGLEQIRAIKGLSAIVAQNILDNRPYKKLDDLLQVKGLGPKLLDKIKDQIKL